MNRIQDFQIAEVKTTKPPKSRLAPSGYGTTGTEFMIRVGVHWYRLMSNVYGNGETYTIRRGGLDFAVNMHDVESHHTLTR